MSREIIIIGAGGHAKVAIATAHAAGFAVRAVYDDNPETHGGSLLGTPVIGGTGDIPPGEPAAIAVGGNRARATLASRLDCQWQTLVHPSAVVHASVQLGAGTLVFAGAVVQPDTIVGEHCIINTSASVDHDCKLGAFVHIAPGSHVAGGVTVGERTFLGIGCTCIPGVTIGSEVTVGAGATVLGDLESGCTVVGTPARPISS